MREILQNIPIPRGSKGLYKKGHIEKDFESEVFKYLRIHEYLFSVHPIHKKYIGLSDGNIISLHTGKIIRPGDNGHGYKFFFAYPGRKRIYVHRFIVECFHGFSDMPEINHINSINTDNRIDNLEYCTRKMNMEHARRNPLYTTTFITNHPDKGKFGYDNKKSKECHQYNLSGEYICSYGSRLEATRKTGVGNSEIGQCCLGNNRTAGGFIWSQILYEKYPIKYPNKMTSV